MVDDSIHRRVGVRRHIVDLRLEGVEILEKLSRLNGQHPLDIFLPCGPQVVCVLEFEVPDRFVLDPFYLVIDPGHKELEADERGCETQVVRRINLTPLVAIYFLCFLGHVVYIRLVSGTCLAPYHTAAPFSPYQGVDNYLAGT